MDSKSYLVNNGGLSRLDRLFSFIILFISSWNMCLPITKHVDLPWWATKIQVLPMVYVNDALFIVYLVLGGFTITLQNLWKSKYQNRLASICMIALALWCALSSTTGPMPLHDAGRAARLIINALLLIAVTQWALNDQLFVLRAFLIGLIAGTISNLIFTFENPYIIIGTLPRLLGQNSPGPAMGIAVCLSGWLLLFSTTRADIYIVIFGTAICSFGALISYSKIGLFTCFMGYLCLVLAIMKAIMFKKQRVILLSYLIIMTGCILCYVQTEEGRETYSSIQQMLDKKYESLDVQDSHSMQERWSYVSGVGEILISHPIGVGFSGFQHAMMRTETYRSGHAADELANEDPSDSNPHAFFLYYASAGGFIGGLLSLIVFFLLWRTLNRGLRTYGFVGIMSANLTGLSYLVMAISVPYLLSLVIMIVPVAVAAGCLTKANKQIVLVST